LFVRLLLSMNPFWLLVCILSFWCYNSYSQSLRITPYRIEEGMPTNFTKSILQDKNGIVWIASDAGLIYYDGSDLVHLKELFPSNYVKSLLLNKDGSVIVGHDAGVSRVIYSKDTVIAETLMDAENETSPLFINNPKTIALFEDPDGHIWVSEQHAMVRYHKGKLKRFPFEEKYGSSYFLRSFVSCHDGHGGFVTASQKGYLFHFDKDKEVFNEIALPEHPGTISALVLSDHGHLLMGTSEGVFELQLNHKAEVVSFKKIIPVKNISYITQVGNELFLGTWFTGLFRATNREGKYEVEQVEGVPDKVVNYIFHDAHDGIWISMDQGLWLMQETYFLQMKFDNQRPFINALFASSKGNFYASDASVIAEFSPKNKKNEGKIVFTIPKDDIRSLIVNDDHLWVGSSNALLYHSYKDKISTLNLDQTYGDIYFMNLDSKGNIWANQLGLKGITKITPDHQIIEYNKDHGFASNIHVVREDKLGNIYCAGSGKDSYLYRYNPQEDKFENISKPLNFKFPGNLHIQDIAFDAQNRLWLASNKGLLIDSGNVVEQVNLSINQINTLIKAVVIDDEDGIWFGTDIGLYRYFDHDLAYFNESNGLPTRNIAYRGICIDKENMIWVATTSGLARTAEAFKPFEKTISPELSAIYLNDKKIGTRQNHFTTNSYVQAGFYAPTFPGETVIYQYRMIGKGQKWFNMGSNNKITLKSSSKGSYAIEVRARQQGEYLWSNPVMYEFFIIYPWYLRWWAIMAYIVLLAVFVYVVVKYNTRRLQNEKVQLEKIIHQRTVEIYNQKEEILLQKDAIEVKSKALEQALKDNNRQKERLEVLNATKDRFFSIVAHDIRGPLGTLSGFTSLLAYHSETMDIKEVQFVAKDLDKAVKNTLELTENLLTWARGQMNNINFNPQAVDLDKIIFANIDLLSSTAHKKGISITHHLNASEQVYVDPEHLHFIVRNLISNAIKFTPANGQISVQTQDREDAIEISVQDSGIGMDAQYLEAIFNIDANISRTGTSGEKGTGLGLILCKDFIEKNGGKMTIQSQPGNGSCFSFTVKKHLSPTKSLG
jgi:signal transduction histidine kinase/ligand-binding sensor domain-containing protein